MEMERLLHLQMHDKISIVFQWCSYCSFWIIGGVWGEPSRQVVWVCMVRWQERKLGAMQWAIEWKSTSPARLHIPHSSQSPPVWFSLILISWWLTLTFYTCDVPLRDPPNHLQIQVRIRSSSKILWRMYVLVWDPEEKWFGCCSVVVLQSGLMTRFFDLSFQKGHIWDFLAGKCFLPKKVYFAQRQGIFHTNGMPFLFCVFICVLFCVSISIKLTPELKTLRPLSVCCGGVSPQCVGTQERLE